MASGLEREVRELRQVEAWKRHWSERPWRGEILKKGAPLSAIGPKDNGERVFCGGPSRGLKAIWSCRGLVPLQVLV